jgi:predicted kinase
MATLYLICGLPGSGKTTLGKRLEISEHALRLSPDEWIAQLLADHGDTAEMDRLRSQVESIQWDVSRRALLLGVNVILENGFWSRFERSNYRQEAKALGADVRLCFLDVPLETLWDRLSHRNSNLPSGSFHVTEEDLEMWSKWFEPPGDGEQFDRFS